MRDQGAIIMTSPEHYEVSYTINPWMKPEEWARDPGQGRRQASAQWQALAARLRAAGLAIELIPGEPGLPDLVFPANAAVVINRSALIARFRYPERQGEEACFRRFFEGLRQRGLLDKVAQFPEGLYQEGAGDCIWDAKRRLFWCGYGPRSTRAAIDYAGEFFDLPTIPLELVTPQYYHLDTCFAPLPGGEILYYPQAFSAATRDSLATLVPAERRIEATAEEAAAFSLNAVAVGRDLIMAPPPPRLRARLEERGYRCLDVDLSMFMMSGGAAYCMTLRLDLTSQGAAHEAAA